MPNEKNANWGGKRAGAGRKKGIDRKKVVVYLSEEEHARLREEGGSKWLRNTLTEGRKQDKMSNVGVAVLASVIDQLGKEYIALMRRAKDKETVYYADAKIDAVLELLGDLESFQMGKKDGYGDEDFRFLDIESLKESLCDARTRNYWHRLGYIEEVKSFGGFINEQEAKDARKRRGIEDDYD